MIINFLINSHEAWEKNASKKIKYIYEKNLKKKFLIRIITLFYANLMKRLLSCLYYKPKKINFEDWNY